MNIDCNSLVDFSWGNECKCPRDDHVPPILSSAVPPLSSDFFRLLEIGQEFANHRTNHTLISPDKWIIAISLWRRLILLLFFKSTPMILRIELSNSSFSSSITFDDSEPRESNFYINFNYDIKFIYIYIYIWIHLESLKNWTLIWKSVIGSLVIIHDWFDIEWELMLGKSRCHCYYLIVNAKVGVKVGVMLTFHFLINGKTEYTR